MLADFLMSFVEFCDAEMVMAIRNVHVALREKLAEHPIYWRQRLRQSSHGYGTAGSRLLYDNDPALTYVLQNRNVCAHCDAPVWRLEPFYSVKLCKPCERHVSAVQTVGRANAQRKYWLTAQQVQELPAVTCGSGGSVLKTHARKRAIEVHSESALDEMTRNADAKRTRLADNRETCCNKRIAALATAYEDMAHGYRRRFLPRFQDFRYALTALDKLKLYAYAIGDYMNLKISPTSTIDLVKERMFKIASFCAFAHRLDLLDADMNPTARYADFNVRHALKRHLYLNELDMHDWLYVYKTQQDEHAKLVKFYEDDALRASYDERVLVVRTVCDYHKIDYEGSLSHFRDFLGVNVGNPMDIGRTAFRNAYLMNHSDYALHLAHLMQTHYGASYKDLEPMARARALDQSHGYPLLNRE